MNVDGVHGTAPNKIRKYSPSESRFKSQQIASKSLSKSNLGARARFGSSTTVYLLGREGWTPGRGHQAQGKHRPQSERQGTSWTSATFMAGTSLNPFTLLRTEGTKMDKSVDRGLFKRAN